MRGYMVDGQMGRLAPCAAVAARGAWVSGWCVSGSGLSVSGSTCEVHARHTHTPTCA